MSTSFSELKKFNYERQCKITGGKHKARGPNPALHLVLSGPAPCFYLAAAPSSLPLVKEQLHVYSPKLHSAL